MVGPAPPCNADKTRQAGTIVACRYHEIRISHRRFEVSEPGMQVVQDIEFYEGNLKPANRVTPSQVGTGYGFPIMTKGSVLLLPAASDDVLGQDKWGLGPSAVYLTMRFMGNWLAVQ